MAGAGWVHFWRQDRGGAVLSAKVVRAAVQGEPIEKMLGYAAQGFLKLGSAERAGVWAESLTEPALYFGTVAEASGVGPPPAEWNRLDGSVPSYRVILTRGELAVEELDASSGVSVMGPAAGMRRAAWIPLRTQQKTFGLVLVAYARPPRAVPLEALQALADELALALAYRREQHVCESWRAELAVRSQLQQAILQGAQADHVLPRIAHKAARHVSAEFVALARNQVGRLDFQFFAGPQEWAALLERNTFSDVWSTAVEQRRVVEVGQEILGNRLARNELLHSERLSRVIAIPLEVRGEGLGVLLAGLTPGADATAGTERLEAYAALAAAALWEEHWGTVAASAAAACRAALESTGEWVLIVDREGTICEASRAAQEHLALAQAPLGRVQLEELFSAPSRDAIRAWRESAGARGEGVRAEGELRNGLTVRLRMRNGPGQSQQPEGRRLVCVEDVTALRRAEQKSQKLEAELVSLLDSLDSGVVLFDASGRIRLVNDRFAQLMGLDARRAAELETFDALVETVAGGFRDPQAFAARWRELRRRGDESSWDELELLHPVRKVIERFARPVFDTAGERIGWLEVYRDMTSHRLIQSKLLRTERMVALGQLVSSIAHELNNPLTSIMGYAQLLLSRRQGLERAGDAHKIYQEAERAGRIVRNLLSFAREAKPERRAVDLNEIVERTVALRSYELKVENITVELDLDPDLPTTLADATQIQQVVLNLIVNAEQAIQQGRGQGHIRVRTERSSAQRLALEVADDGPGIPPEIISRIFDPFFTTKPVGMGTGLGLSIVYGIVQEHSGEVSVESQPGRGTTFAVELPIVAATAAETHEEEAAPATAPLAVVAAESVRAAARRERILVVEDEPTVAQLIADVLRDEGHRVDTVLDSREGLDRISRENYHLVICDLRMPYLDGRAFYRALVRSGSPLQHRIVFVTGDTLASHTLEFLDSTGLPYLPKPFLVEELKLVVRRALVTVSDDVRLAAGGEPDPTPSRSDNRSRDATRKR